MNNTLLVTHQPVVLLITDYLRAKLSSDHKDLYIGRTVPQETKAKMVIVSNRGGTSVDVVRDRSIIDVNVTATRDHDADILATNVKGWLKLAPWNVTDLMAVRVVMLPTDVPSADGRPQRLLRFAVTHRGRQNT